MELLFEREQTSSALDRIAFKLKGKVEFNEEEQELVKRYKFDAAMLIEAYQPELVRKTAVRAVLIFLGVLLFCFISMSYMVAFFIAICAGGGFGYWYYHQNRETIYVRDLMRGRYFVCDSVVALARKEAWLELICSFLRQVMESAKHWDGATRVPIKALPKDEAKQIIIKGI